MSKAFNERESQNPNEPQAKFLFFSLCCGVPPQKQWKVEQVEQHAADVFQLKRGFSRATAHAQHTCDGFGGQRAFWSFLELFGAFWCTDLWCCFSIWIL
jgi:hypothetical protein